MTKLRITAERLPMMPFSKNAPNMELYRNDYVKARRYGGYWATTVKRGIWNYRAYINDGDCEII